MYFLESGRRFRAGFSQGCLLPVLLHGLSSVYTLPVVFLLVRTSDPLDWNLVFITSFNSMYPLKVLSPSKVTWRVRVQNMNGEVKAGKHNSVHKSYLGSKDSLSSVQPLLFSVPQFCLSAKGQCRFICSVAQVVNLARPSLLI